MPCHPHRPYSLPGAPAPGLRNNVSLQGAAVCPGRDIMHALFIELFIETDADDLLAEEERRRRVRRSRRARSAMVVRPAGNRQHQPRP